MTTSIENFVTDHRAQLGIPGLALAINLDDETIVDLAIGEKRLGCGEEVTGRTCFHMASVTKPFTSLGIMKLIEEKKVALHDPVLSFFNDRTPLDQRFHDMTVQHLLSHTSGLGDVEDFEWESPRFDEDALSEHVHGLIGGYELNNPPGESYDYSDLGYETLGAIIASASSKTYEEYIYDSFMKPAGMTNSALCYAETNPLDLASSHLHNNKGELDPSDVFPYNRRHTPSSTLCSCSEDMAKWMRFCQKLDRGTLPKILDKKSFKAAREKTNNTGGTFWSEVGQGFFRGEYRGISYYGHEGSDEGFRAIMVLTENINCGITLISNMDGDNLKPIVEGIFEILLATEL